MSEQVSVCKIDNPFKSYSKDRAEFYSEQIQAFKDTGAPTEAVEVIDVFLFNRSGEFLVQKEIVKNTDSFTDDFIYLFNTYKQDIRQFIDILVDKQ